MGSSSELQSGSSSSASSSFPPGYYEAVNRRFAAPPVNLVPAGGLIYIFAFTGQQRLLAAVHPTEFYAWLQSYLAEALAERERQLTQSVDAARGALSLDIEI